MRTLCLLADQLVDKAATIEEAWRTTTETITGRLVLIAGMRHRVLPSTRQVEDELRELRSYISSRSIEDSHRWAGALIMVFAMLALGASASARELVKEACESTGAIWPVAAREFVAAMILVVGALDETEAQPSHQAMSEEPPAADLRQMALEMARILKKE